MQILILSLATILLLPLSVVFGQSNENEISKAIAISSAIQKADAEELKQLGTALKALPDDDIEASFRIRLGGTIAIRFLELKLPELAESQFLYALSIPHPSNGKESTDCANMWVSTMDTLLYHFNHSYEYARIMPTLDDHSNHADSLGFRAGFCELRAKWLGYTGDKEGAEKYARQHVTEILAALPELPEEYELEALLGLANCLQASDLPLQIRLLERITDCAETRIRDNKGAQSAFSVFRNARNVLSRNVVIQQDDSEDLAQYDKGMRELAKIASENISGEFADVDRKTIFRDLDEFEKAQKMRIEQLIAPLVGRPAPKLSGEWISETKFESLEALKGQVIVIDFWAIWCGPCIASFPKMEKLQQDFSSQGLTVIGVTNWEGYVWDSEKEVAVRGDSENPDAEDHAIEKIAIRKFVNAHKLTTPQLCVTKEITRDYHIDSLPTLVIIDKNGVVAKVLTDGSEATHATLRHSVEELLSQKSPQ